MMAFLLPLLVGMIAAGVGASAGHYLFDHGAATAFLALLGFTVGAMAGSFGALGGFLVGSIKRRAGTPERARSGSGPGRP